MRCGFRPHDHDRKIYSMEVSLLSFGLVLRGFLLQHINGLCGYPVNRWSTKRPPNGMKLDRRSTGGIPRPLGKSGPIRRCLIPTHERKLEMTTGGERSAGMQNGQRGKCSNA